MNFGAVWWIAWFILPHPPNKRQSPLTPSVCEPVPLSFRAVLLDTLYCSQETPEYGSTAKAELEAADENFLSGLLPLLSYWCFPNPQVWSVRFPFEMDHFFINFTVNHLPISFVYARWTRWFPPLCDTALGTRAQTIPSLQRIPHCGLSWKEGEGVGSALSFPFTLPHQCKWELQSCILSLPPSSRTLANARAAQLGCVPTTEAPWLTECSCSISYLLLMPWTLLSIWKNTCRGIAGGIPQFPQEKWGEYLNPRLNVSATVCWLWVSLGSQVWSCHYADILWDHKGSSHSLRPLSSSQSTMVTGWSGTTVTEGVPRLLTAEMYTRAHILTFPGAGKGEGGILTSVAQSKVVRAQLQILVQAFLGLEQAGRRQWNQPYSQAGEQVLWVPAGESQNYI